ncbi:hypothetical protein T484DRAFT_1816246 [Baffinella frigidus]|nr:hypothetical protein T484DRAFT_1816246 [Cryptophyta sp. CCMP2293]
MLKRVKSLGKAMGFSRKGSKSGAAPLLRHRSESARSPDESAMSPEADYVFKSAGELLALQTLVEQVRMQLGLLGGKSAARLRCSAALESILAVVQEQHDGLAKLELVADAKERSGVASEDVQLFERAWGAVREELSATSEAVLQAQQRIALLPGGGIGVSSMASCAEEVERCGIELKIMVEGVLEKLPTMPAMSETRHLFSPLAAQVEQSITPASQADTEMGHERYLSSGEEGTPSPVPLRQEGQQSPFSESAPSPCSPSLTHAHPGIHESTTPRESPPPACESPKSPPARHCQVLPPPSPFDAGAGAALDDIPTPSAAEEEVVALRGAWQQPSPLFSPTRAAGQEEPVLPFSPFDAEPPQKLATPPAARPVVPPTSVQHSPAASDEATSAARALAPPSGGSTGVLLAATPPRTAALRCLLEKDLLEETPEGKGLARGLFQEVEEPSPAKPSPPAAVATHHAASVVPDVRPVSVRAPEPQSAVLEVASAGGEREAPARLEEASPRAHHREREVEVATSTPEETPEETHKLAPPCAPPAVRASASAVSAAGVESPRCRGKEAVRRGAVLLAKADRLP